jgi:sugar/nucleoside kinase (ribokinase family)
MTETGGVVSTHRASTPVQPARGEPLRDILVVGSGNAETVLDLGDELVIGQKHDVKRVELYGGSGVNYTLRLTHYDGTRVLPILSIGQDAIGRSIRQELLQAMDAGHARTPASDFVADPDLLCIGLTTPQSTVITTNEQRTIFREVMRGAEHFCAFAVWRLKQVLALNGSALNVGAVMIGHIYADRPGVCTATGGSITKEVIRAFRDRAILFANFGESQYCMGASFWEKELRALTVFQLSVEEARSFFWGCDRRAHRCPALGTPRTLAEMLRWFQEREITAVLTLDRFGAVATFRGHEGVIFAPAFELDNFVDSTGAGDAFGAGLVHSLCQAGRAPTLEEFVTAITTARLWSAYACTTRGAASQCPSQAELAAFEDELHLKGQAPEHIDCRDLAAWDGILRILDKAY